MLRSSRGAPGPGAAEQWAVQPQAGGSGRLRQWEQGRRVGRSPDSKIGYGSGWGESETAEEETFLKHLNFDLRAEAIVETDRFLLRLQKL